MLYPAKTRWKDRAKSAVSAGQDSPRQPEIAPAILSPRILVGNPLPHALGRALALASSLHSQHGFAMKVKVERRRQIN